MTTEKGNGQQRLAMIETPAGQVFIALVKTMEADNCCNFSPTQADIDDAVPHIGWMMDAGYFAGDLAAARQDLDSDVWIAAGGEDSEAAQHFYRCPESFAAVASVLNRVFDRPYTGPWCPVQTEET